MNHEKLLQGQKAWEDIKKIERFISVLQNGYVNTITGFDYSHGKDGERISMELNGELREIVITYLSVHLHKLKGAFEKL